MPEANDIIQVRLRATFCGEPIVNSFGFLVVNPEADWAAQASVLAGEVDTAIGFLAGGGPWDTGLSVQYKGVALDVVDVYPGVGPLVSFASGAVGTVVDEDAMPPNDALAVTLRSAFRGQGSRGRVYLTGFAEGSANGGYWEAGAQAYADGVMSNLISSFGELGSAGHRWCIIHRSSNGGVKNAPVVPLIPPEGKPVMDITVHNEVRSIGRRAVGRRVHRKRTAP